MADSTRLLDVLGLQALIDVLRARGFTVIGPTVQGGAIAPGPVATVDDLPRGWGDEQEAATYRLRRRDDDAFFAFASGAQSIKPVVFPASEVVWRGRRVLDDFTTETVEPGADPGTSAPPYACLGVRACDLAALAIQDTVLTSRAYVDVRYASRRADSFVVAVTCTDPGGTCFCASMGTGPRPGDGYDLALTELLDDGPHRFLIDVGTERGREVLAEVPTAPAWPADVLAADTVAERAAAHMGRTLDTDGIKELLYSNVDSPQWDEIASRCLACTNCTLVCPTCFCTSVEDVADLTGDVAERRRVWDSCFSDAYSYVHGGSVRPSASARYRQWMTHKLGSWIDQFGMSGCVGCGRCITWCPAAIDITAEVAVMRGRPQAPETIVAGPQDGGSYVESCRA